MMNSSINHNLLIKITALISFGLVLASPLLAAKEAQTDSAMSNDEMFKALDKDNNNAITASEMRDYPYVQEHFIDLDKDNDGRLDKSEFSQFKPIARTRDALDSKSGQAQ